MGAWQGDWKARIMDYAPARGPRAHRGLPVAQSRCAADKDVGDRRTRDFSNRARQLRPRLIVPLTHHESDFDWSLEHMGERVETVLDALALDRSDLRAGPERIVKLVSTYAE